MAQPTRVIAVLLAVVLAYTVLGPIIAILTDAFRMSTLEAINTDGTPGVFTWDHIQRVFASDASQQVFWTPVGHTAVVGVAATAMAVVFGLSLAMLVARTNIAGRSSSASCSSSRTCSRRRRSRRRGAPCSATAVPVARSA